jgi:hypothetical protein
VAYEKGETYLREELGIMDKLLSRFLYRGSEINLKLLG